ncbi:uncharacterized protein LOC113402004 [Vanessa tameamea]|uniref:Uncharacterized protein LOC113402004 n=1 Tax=Vanessa tameamea TaxID=334116 RepID=A0A8B8IN49_VANTA
MDQQLLLCGAILTVCGVLKKKLITSLKKKKKRFWMRNLLKSRKMHGASNTLCANLNPALECDVEDHDNFFRIPKNLFDDLLRKVEKRIEKKDTLFREALPARLKLEVTLRYLATGDSYKSLYYLFRVSPSIMSSFIPEVCDALYDALADYIKVPNTEQKWMDIKTGFQLKWNFPGCIGAIDGKHINLRAPACSGSEFYNYKKTFSIVLLACVDDDYSFTYIDIGAKARYSDGGVFSNCSLKRAIDDGSLNIPAENVIVADAAFPLQNNIMKPYPGNNLTTRQKIFNYRLSRARRIVENAFGILASRFRIFEKPIANNVKNTIKITRTSCALHNWLRKNDSNYLEPGLADYEDISTGITINGSWRQVPLRNFEDMGEDNTLTENGTTIRDRFADYFSSEGAVPWQTRFIH